MKKMYKTLIALCLTVAMLTSLFAGVSFASGGVCVEWYGFDNNVTVPLGAGTYTSVAPSMFPANATETDLIWSVSDENKATIDQNGVVTLLAKGTVTVYATLENTSALVRDPSFGVKGASYTLTITDVALNANPGEVKFASAGKVKNVGIEGATGPLVIEGTSNALVSTAEVINDSIVAVSALAPGYAEITVSDGTNSLVIPVFVQPVDLIGSLETWRALFPQPAEGETVSASQAGYLQWWMESIPINKNATGANAGAGVLGYGKPMLHTENLTVTHSGNTAGDGKTFFRWLNDGSNYYNFNLNKGATAQDKYQFFNIRAPKKGTVNISPKSLEGMSSDRQKSDGSYIAIFVEDSQGNLTRVFPAETDADEYVDDSNNYAILNVTRNWLWVYPTQTYFGKFQVGDTYHQGDSNAEILDPAGEPYKLTQERYNEREDFVKNGATFDVAAGDIIRVVMHCGHDEYADSIGFTPIFRYLDADVTGVVESETATDIQIVKGKTTTFMARLTPIGATAPVSFSSAYKAGTNVTFKSAVYRTGSDTNLDDYGCVDITLEAAEDSALGVGYYRVNFGTFSKLIRVSVVNDASGGDAEDGEEAGVEVVLGENAGSDTTPEGPGDEGGDEPFTFEFNTKDTSVSLSEVKRTLSRITWKNSNTTDTAKEYCIFTVPEGGLGEVIDLGNLPQAPADYGYDEFTASANASDSNEGSALKFTPSTTTYWGRGKSIDIFWFVGSWDNLAKNGLYTLYTQTPCVYE